MASFEETKIAGYQEQIRKLNAAIRTSVTSGKPVLYNGDELTVAEAAKIIDQIQLDLDSTIERREKSLNVRDKRSRQESLLTSQVDDALNKLDWAIDARNKGAISEAVLNQYVAAANDKQRQLDTIRNVATSRPIAGATEMGAGAPPAAVPPSSYLDPKLATLYKDKFGKDPDVNVQAGEGGTDGAGGTGAGGTGAGGRRGRGKQAPVPTYQPGWEDEVRRSYAKYSWMLDELDRTKYQDVFDLLAEAVNPDTKITDPRLFQDRFEGTSWYQELATQQTGRRVRAQVGALSFDSGNYARFLNNAMRYGWEGDNLKAEAYKEVFRRNDDGSYANPNAIGEARKSSDYLSVQRIGTAFLSPMSDERVVDTLTGKTTQDDLLRVFREKAKVNNPHLAAAIDAGVTLEDLAYDYRKAASDVLGMPVTAVPLTEDFLGQALRAGEPGKYRVMTTNEWKYLLKSNPEYGYQYTAKARDEVNDIVQSLEKAFGFVR